MTGISFRLWGGGGGEGASLSTSVDLLKVSKVSWSSSTLFLLGFERRVRTYWKTCHCKAVSQKHSLGGGKGKEASYPALCY